MILAPATVADVTAALRWALAAKEAFEVVSGGSKRALGRPMRTAHCLDMSALSGIVSYEPSELVLTAFAGTPMAMLEAALAEHSQTFIFEPPDLGELVGAPAHVEDVATGTTRAIRSGGTLGGVVAIGHSGPRRFKAGAVRDHVLGLTAVSGRAEAFVAGGKVVKNVTGYDLPKLLTGSHGTLAVLMEITLKVLPAADYEQTLVIRGLSVARAVECMASVQQTAVDVSGACHLPEGVGAPGALASGAQGSVTAFRLEGVRPSVSFRFEKLRGLVESLGSLETLDREASRHFWRDVRDVRVFLDMQQPLGTVWRISVPPAQGAAVLERVQRAIPRTLAFLDWGGALLWVSIREISTEHASLVREAVASSGGHATLIRAPETVRASVDVFQPQDAPLAALSKRVKAQFDPSGVLNPGRMYAGV